MKHCFLVSKSWLLVKNWVMVRSSSAMENVEVILACRNLYRYFHTHQGLLSAKHNAKCRMQKSDAAHYTH